MFFHPSSCLCVCVCVCIPLLKETCKIISDLLLYEVLVSSKNCVLAGLIQEGEWPTTTLQSYLITFSRNNLQFNLTYRHIKLVLLIRTRLLIKQAELATGESYLEIQWQFYIFNKGSEILLQSRWYRKLWSNSTFINNWSVERDRWKLILISFL